MASTKLALARTRQRYRERTETWERKGVGLLTSATTGYLEQSGTLPVAIAGAPSKLVLGIGMALIAGMSSGTMSRWTNAASESLLNVYAYQAVKTQNFVAGGFGRPPGYSYGQGGEL